MNCNEVERALSEESRLPLEAQEHVRSCNRCQELVTALNTGVPVDPPSPATLRQIADKMATNLRPVRPIAPARYFLGLWSASLFSSSLLVSTAWARLALQ